MLWPDAESTELIAGDHADIIGHYRRAEDPSARWFESNDPLAEARPCARKYHTYDIFGSSSEFGDREFQAVWEDILDFSVGASLVLPTDDSRRYAPCCAILPVANVYGDPRLRRSTVGRSPSFARARAT